MSIGLVFGSMNLVTKNVANDDFFHESRLKQVLEAMFDGDLLCHPNVIDDLRDITHGWVAKLSITALVVERPISRSLSRRDESLRRARGRWVGAGFPHPVWPRSIQRASGMW